MIVRNQQEALCVAVEMERRAIKTYQRASLLCKDPEVLAGIQSILKDEQGHLEKFMSMKQGCPCEQMQENLIIKALAAETLFPGGVMEMDRAKGLDSLKGLYMFAMDSEQSAINQYAAFAEKCADPAIASAFHDIVCEEVTHLTHLQEVVRELPS